MIRIYTIRECSYCNKLKELLKKDNLEFDEIDGDLPENDSKFLELFNVTKSYNVPTIIVNKSILVPEVSFNTIDEGFELIKRIINHS